MSGWRDGLIDRWVDGPDGWMGRWMDGWMEGERESGRDGWVYIGTHSNAAIRCDSAATTENSLRSAPESRLQSHKSRTCNTTLDTLLKM